MHLRLLLLLTLVACWRLPAAAQRPSKVGFQLASWLEQAAADQQVDLFLGGEPAALDRAVRAHGGRPRMSVPGWLLASVPAAQVQALAGETAVRSIVFNVAPGHVLNDSMRVKAHVDHVHAGLAPLPQAYQGHGVLLGIIDTGIELTHPDFLDSLGRTRVLHYWDQNYPYDPVLTPAGFDYGQAWDSTAINAGQCPAVDDPAQWGHGTTVAATAAANSNGNGHCAGVAPQADLIIVANDLYHPNWGASIVDAVQYIVEQAAALNRPVAINLSLGSYYGSHDGLDPAALMIDQLLAEAPGRVLVCAAGNSGNLPPYHLRTEVGTDTTFTWFAYNANSVLGTGAMYFDLWADTADFNPISYSIGADKFTGGFARRGHIPFRNIQGTLGQVVTDTLWSVDGDRLGLVSTYAQLRGGQYNMEVYIPEPDSAGQLYYRFMTTGAGRFDVWSSDLFGTSRMITALPDSTVFPEVVHYVPPDNQQSIVDSWACSPQVITVGNFYNQQVYTDVSGAGQDLGYPPGTISINSSRGPTRTGLVKPDLAAPADVTFGAGPWWALQMLLDLAPDKMIDSLHMRNGGTSIASPVVAGTAALLLEKCPRADHASVRDMLMATASTDSATGAVPNFRFGHGKVDAFAALVSTHVPVPLSQTGPLCAGDSVLVAGPGDQSSYLWNTGDTTQQVWTTGGTLQLTVETASGCKGLSDSLTLVPAPLPIASISMAGMVLTCSTAAAYQWFLNGQPLPGAVDPVYEAVANGPYTVLVTDSAGCMAFSDTVIVLSVGLQDASTGGRRVWPVPAVDVLWFSEGLPQMGATAYEILDVGGRCVQRGPIGAQVAAVPVGALAAGLYVLRLHAGDAQEMHRFTKGN
ncbi:MAG: S8 family serine peptidase [Flavobacteriales bacterium]|nr:S8 family serine peptidase [Flavobacteriales bacterium]